jgi:hypothetical protein
MICDRSTVSPFSRPVSISGPSRHGNASGSIPAFLAVCTAGRGSSRFRPGQPQIMMLSRVYPSRGFL